jgi:hypothetical protein
MKDRHTPPLYRTFATHNQASQRSSALIIVLACLVFISVLILAFFASITTERQSAQFYANNSSVKLLSDSTLSIVMGQIVNATRGTDANGLTLSWASQPGMIRNYNLQGSAAGYYKLYSWTNMIGTGAFNPYATGEQVPANWASSKALYTDLNEPIVEGSGVSSVTNYPIVDPSATNTVIGFSISNTAPISPADYAPMPVQWLYVLQRGQVITPDSGGNGTTVTFAQSSLQPNATNQIVGRIAFWTDDDTSKVNINTAAGDVWVNANGSSSGPALMSPGNPGSSWDTPRLFSTTETNLAYAQPANGEYQRYPGHPSTVYLSAVFPTLLTTPAQIYALSPRVALGGSLSGTTYPPASMLTTTPAQVNSSRLYTSVDELLCATNITSGVRSLNSGLSKSAVEQAKFFLTAASRAPEVNLYNQPRVVVWPVSSTGTTVSIGTYCTAYDRLLAYCGTINKNYYYFQRSPTGASSSTADLPASASATVPATDLTRNRQLITYLRNLTSQPVPGFSTGGETFQSKYPMDRDEILTEIFDYIRSLNTQDLGVSNPYSPTTWKTPGEGQIFPIVDTTHADSNSTQTRGFGHLPVITEATLLFAGIGQHASTGTATSVYGAGGPVLAGQTRIQAALLLKFFDPSQGYAPLTPNFTVKVTGLSSMTWNGSSIGFHDPATITVTSLIVTGAQGTGGEIGVSPCVWATGYTDINSGLISANTLDVPSGSMTTPATFNTSDTTFTVAMTDTLGNSLQTYNLEFPAGTFPVPGLAPLVQDTGTSVPPVDFRNLAARFNPNNSTMQQTYICGTDVARSIALTTDPRLIVPLSNVPLQYAGGPNSGKNIYAKVAGYDTSTVLRAHGIFDMAIGGHRGLVGYTTPGKLVNSTTYSGTETSPEPDFIYNATTPLSTAWGSGVQIQTSTTKSSGVASATGIYDANIFSLVGGYAVGTPGVFLPGSTTIPGDWDTGNSQDKDGAYINKADEGAIPYNHSGVGLFLPYYSAGYATSTNFGSTLLVAIGANFSPNRQMPSAGMFGSLPTGVFSNKPWQTLLFRPSPDGKILPSESPVHIGAQSPQDHLLMDLYDMPVVEPYAISDPFSTAGKVNMNYQIVPFTYLTRSTAVQAAMRGEQMVAVPGTMGISGPPFTGVPAYKGNTTTTLRFFLDLSQTLTGFNNMFTTGTPDGTGSTPDIFRSATQICNIWLVPAGKSLTYSGMSAFWLDSTASGGILTGDNVRERPYANLYQKLTTKSNTFTVHMRVQNLKMVQGVDPTYASWTEAGDQIIGEYRGSSTIERYLDTSSANIPDYATTPQPLTAGQAIDNFYKFRVVETKQFTP